MSHGFRSIGVAAIALLVLTGCERRVSAPPARPTAAAVPLPEWAPNPPSAELLRAMRVMRPFGTPGAPSGVEQPGPESDLAARVLAAHYHRTLLPACELLGSLDDAQLTKLQSEKEVRLPMKSLTAKQRGFLERFFDLWRHEMKDLPERENAWSRDWLVELYKGGAREDLSNVLVTFRIRGSGRVLMALYVVQPDGRLSHPFPAGLGDVIEPAKGY